MNKRIIYCFSGTGNSLYAALIIAKNVGETDVVLMRPDTQHISTEDADMIGFVFPVYFWAMPCFVKDYIQELKLNANAYCFGIASCGGIAINALNDLEKLLNEKDISLSYSKVHKNVASYVGAYEPFPKIGPTVIQSKKDLKVIADEIKARKKNQPVKPSAFKGIMRLISNPYLRALPNKDRGFCVSDDCIACGLCEKVCSVRNIRMINDRPEFAHWCAQCMACIVYCPKQAINYKGKTQERTKYHHPDISADLLLESTIHCF